MPADEAISADRLKELLLQTEGVLTMMFTDIVNSTGIKAKVGDEPYFAALSSHNRLVRDCVGAPEA